MEMETKTQTDKKSLSISYETVKTLIKSQNLTAQEVVEKLKFYGYNNFLIDYSDAQLSSVRSLILASKTFISSLIYTANLQNKGDYFKELEVIDFCYYNKVKKLVLKVDLPTENAVCGEYLFNVKQI